MTEKDIIEEILEEAWEEHKNTPNFGTYDTEGINNLVRIAIKKSIQSQKQKIIEDELMFLESIDKTIDIDLDKLKAKEYFEVFKIAEEVNKYGLLVKREINKLQELLNSLGEKDGNI